MVVGPEDDADLGRQMAVALALGGDRVEGVGLGRQLVPVVAQGRDDAEAAAQQFDLVLNEEACEVIFGLGEGADGEDLAHRGHGAAANAFLAGARPVAADGDAVLHRRPAKGLGPLRRHAPDRVVEGDVAGAVHRRGAVLIGELGGRGVLPVGGDRAVIQTEDVVEAPVEADAVALGLVVGGQADDGGGVAAERLAIHVLIEVVVGQADGVVGVGVPDQLAQDGVRGELLRVGPGAGRACAADLGHVFSLMGVAAGVGQQAGQRAGAARERQTLGPAVVRRVVADAASGAEALAAIDEVGRVLGGEADGAGDAVGTIEGRGRAAQDFDGFDQVQVVVAAATDALGAEGEAVRDADAVLDDEHAVAAHAADGEARVAVAAGARQGGGEAGGAGRDADARLEPDQVLDVGDEVVLDGLGGDHADAGRDIVHAALGAGADHGDRGDRNGLFQIRNLVGEGGEGGGRKGGQPGGEHQKRAHGYSPGWRGLRNYCERLSESTAIVARS
ncbi:hypothetical protein D3C72_947890 [compost metagenome]